MKYKNLYVTFRGHIVNVNTTKNWHVYLPYKILCSKVVVDYTGSNCAISEYNIRHHDICQKCLDKLPKKILDRLHYEYIVYKLKK